MWYVITDHLVNYQIIKSCLSLASSCSLLSKRNWKLISKCFRWHWSVVTVSYDLYLPGSVQTVLNNFLLNHGLHIIKRSPFLNNLFHFSCIYPWIIYLVCVHPHKHYSYQDTKASMTPEVFFIISELISPQHVTPRLLSM